MYIKVVVGGIILKTSDVLSDNCSYDMKFNYLCNYVCCKTIWSMKIIDGFVLRSVAGEMIVGGESIAQMNFNKLISLNESAAYLWQEVVGSEFTVEQLAALLVERYEIDLASALVDVEAIAQSWIEAGLVEA